MNDKPQQVLGNCGQGSKQGALWCVCVRVYGMECSTHAGCSFAVASMAKRDVPMQKSSTLTPARTGGAKKSLFLCLPIAKRMSGAFAQDYQLSNYCVREWKVL